MLTAELARSGQGTVAAACQNMDGEALCRNRENALQVWRMCVMWCVQINARLPSGLDSLQIEQSDDEQPAGVLIVLPQCVCVAVMSACHVTVTRHGPRCVTPPPRHHQSSWNEFYLFDNINNPGPASHATILPAPSATCNDTPHIVAIVQQYTVHAARRKSPASSHNARVTKSN